MKNFGEKIKDVGEKVLHKEKFTTLRSNFTPDKDIQHGSDYIEKLKERGMIDHDDIFKIHMLKMTTIEEHEPLDLVKVSMSDLGFPEGTHVSQMYEAAKEQGLELCPAWVGPQLCLDLTPDEQQKGYFSIAMEALPEFSYPIMKGVIEPTLNVFNIDHSGGHRYLGMTRAKGWENYGPDSEWVFVRKKQ